MTSTRISWVVTFLLYMLGALATPLAAQAPTVNIRTPYKVAFDHDRANTTHYRVYVRQGTGPIQKQGQDISTADLQAGLILDLPAIATAGGYALIVGAVNVDPSGIAIPSETQSDPLLFTVVVPTMPAPGKPTNLRIVLVASISPAGLVTFEIRHVSLLAE